MATAMKSRLGAKLFKEIRKEAKKQDTITTTNVSYPTGFVVLDYMNGQEIDVYDEDDELMYTYHSIGLVGGTMITFIGKSSTGKSTATQQMAASIVAQFSQGLTPYDINIDSYINFEDVENANNASRAVNITNMGPRWTRDHYSIFSDCSSEDIVDRFKDHCNNKIEDPDWNYDTGLHDIYGDKIITKIPTAVIIDSLATMMSKEITLDDGTKDATGNMQGARNAKFNNSIFKVMIQMAKKANVLIFVVNHRIMWLIVVML